MSDSSIPIKNNCRNGNQEWSLDGVWHRVDGPAVIESDGTQHWWLFGKMHRENGPAYTSPDGRESWFIDGAPHRVDGPAITRSDGVKKWWLFGVEVTEQDHSAFLEYLLTYSEGNVIPYGVLRVIFIGFRR